MKDRDAPPNPHASADRTRLLDLLESAHEDPPTMNDMRERGVTMPGQAIYELELDGYPIERVRHGGGSRSCGGVGYRLRRQRR
jgi:hypothetical protein